MSPNVNERPIGKIIKTDNTTQSESEILNIPVQVLFWCKGIPKTVHMTGFLHVVSIYDVQFSTVMIAVAVFCFSTTFFLNGMLYFLQILWRMSLSSIPISQNSSEFDRFLREVTNCFLLLISSCEGINIQNTGSNYKEIFRVIAWLPLHAF